LDLFVAPCISRGVGFRMVGSGGNPRPLVNKRTAYVSKLSQ